jgi:LmbE family N-acetylglucosaminyl deacetylase/2-polyprenyl-3-methyl-5-hydroxy-6-metoxy-1,4-benzoquinol methylase
MVGARLCQANMNAPLVVIAPHPDDELLGAGAIMARAMEAQTPVAVIVVTDGGASDPAFRSDELRRRRYIEVTAGIKVMLGSSPKLLFLNQRDGAFDARQPEIDPGSEIATFLAAMPDARALVTDPADAHPDHKATFGFASRLSTAGLIRQLDVMPISQRVDGAFDPSGFETHPVGELRSLKAAALACHRSQIDSNTGFSLSGSLINDFCLTEYTRRVHDCAHAQDEAVGVEHFETMFRKSPDPWHYDTEAYEADRFERTVAALGGKMFKRALELGCANGALTSKLISHCDTLVATDVSHAALGAARRRLGDVLAVTFVQGQLPHDVPEGQFDLIVVSDMLYYLGLQGVAKLMEVLEDRADPRCRIVMTNYLGETECALSGEMAAEIALAHLPGWTKVAAERTALLRIDVLERA